MNRRQFRISVSCASLLCIFGNGSVAAQVSTLTVYTWSEYMDPTIVAEFEKQHQTRVNFTYFDSDELRDKELTASGGTGFDVIMVNDVQMSRYVKSGWVAPLTGVNVPNLKYIDTRWTSTDEEAPSGFGAAYFWGTMGIAWRSDLYPEGFSSWRELIKPDARLSGRIMMSDYNRELIGFALKSDGHSINTTDRSLIRAAGQKLLAQKPHVLNYGYPAITEESSLVTGEIWACTLYSGDALVLQEFNDNIEYRIPEEGGLLWVDYITIASNSGKKPLAAAFIDFLNRPAIAARNAEYVSFATPNQAARALVSSEYLDSAVIHPTESQLRNSEFLRSLPARSTKSVNTAVSEVRAN